MNQFLTRIENTRIELFFLVAGLVFGISAAAITPPFQAPDEHNHFARAYQVSEGQLISEKLIISKDTHIIPYEYVNLTPRQDQSVASGGNLPISIAIAFETASKGIEFYAERKHDLNNTLLLLNQPLNEHQKNFFHFANTAVYSPVPYLPQSIGVASGRIAGFSPLILMYLGRLTNLFVWLFVIYYAIKLSPVNKHILLLLALMPMPLFQASSLSADACINGFSFLLASIAFKMAYQTDELRKKDFFLLIVVSLIITLSKMAYIPLVGVALIIPFNRITNKRVNFFIISAGIFVCIIAGVSWIKVADSLYVPYVPFSSSREQLNFILENPRYYLTVVFSILKTPGLHLVDQYIGRLGWLDTEFPVWFYALHVMAVIGVVVSEPKTTLTSGVVGKTIIALCILCSFLVVITTVYLYWTPVGLDKVAVQGRYFIPLGPFIFLMLIDRFRMFTMPYRNTSIFCFCLFSLGCMVYQLIRRYYL